MIVDFQTETFVTRETNLDTRRREHLDGERLSYVLRIRCRVDWTIDVSAVIRFS